MYSQLWSQRLKAVNGEIEEVRKKEFQDAIARQAALAKTERHSRFHVEDTLDDKYTLAVERAVVGRGYTAITGQTHGTFAQLLPNLAEGVKKSAQKARMETKSDPEKGEIKEVHSIQTRSFHSGGSVFFVKAFAPRLFCRIRNHFGLSYESFSRCLEQDHGGYMQCGDFYFTTRTHLVFRKIDDDDMSLILSVLENYSAYVAKNPYSLLPHWYGIFSATTAGLGSHLFLVTNNVLHTVDSIDFLFDLKGSTFRHSRKKARGGKQFVLPKKLHPKTKEVGRIPPRCQLVCAGGPRHAVPPESESGPCAGAVRGG